MGLAREICYDWDEAAPAGAAEGPVVQKPYSQLLPAVLQLAPAVFAVVHKYSSEKGMPAASNPAGGDSEVLGSFGSLLDTVIDKCGDGSGEPCCQQHTLQSALCLSAAGR